MGHLDYPFYDVAESADKAVQAGATVHQKFTCAKCGSRQTMEQPNTFFALGECEECGSTTDLVERGCNYVEIWSRSTVR